MILDRETLTTRLPDIVVKGYRPDNLGSASYDLSLGKEYYTTNSKEEAKQVVSDSKQITIEPGQLAILITDETIHLPNDLIAFISIRFSVKFKGLVNVSGFHVDPGFKGKLKFSVYNAGSRTIVLDAEKPTFPIWFSELKKPLKKGDLYDGDHNNQDEIDADDVSQIQGKIYSPNVLRDELQRIENVELKRVENKFDTALKGLEGSISTEVARVQGEVGKVDTKRTISTTILIAVGMLAITTFVNVLLSSYSADLWRNQGRFERDVNDISNRSSSSNSQMAQIENRLGQLEKRMESQMTSPSPTPHK